MKLIPIAAMCAILATCPAIAQDAPTAPSAVPAADPLCDNLKDVPKGKGVLLMALRDRTLEIPYSTAVACETERCRLKATGVIGQCVWVR